MKRRITSTILALSLLLALLPTTVLAASPSSGSWGNLTWSFDGTDTLTISGSGDMPDLEDSSDSPFYSFRTKIQHITIQQGINSIGNEAFEFYWNLTDVTIPGSVTSIGYNAFARCGNLTEVRLSDNLKSIGGRAFANCSALTSVTIPNGVQSIGRYAFFNSGLTGITIPGSVNFIGTNAFDGCEELTEITVSEGVTSLGERALAGCKNLSSIDLPNSLTSIGERAFAGTGGCDIIIPGSVATIGEYAFYDSKFRNITLSYGTTSIDGHAFASCGNLSSISLPDSLVSIGRYAFDGTGGCDIVIPGSVTTIGTRAFYGCKFDNITIPESVTLIEERAFENTGCSGTIIIPGSVTSIEKEAFYRSSFKSVVLSEGVQVIRDYAFWDCKSLSNIKLPDTLTVIGPDAFRGCEVLTGISIPRSVNYIGSSAFAESGLTHIEIPEGVLVIDSNTFSGCVDLTAVALPDTVALIEYSAFVNCNKLKDINMPTGLRKIGVDAFRNCTQLPSLKIPEGVTEIGAGAFYGCSNLNQIILPDTLFGSNIGDGTFYDCDKLTELTIPEGVKRIGEDAFLDCDVLEAVSIPGSVEYIGWNCFKDCPALATVNYGGPKWRWDEEQDIPNNLKVLGIPSAQNVTINYFPGGKCGENAYWYYNAGEGLLYVDNPSGEPINRPDDGSESDWDEALKKFPFIYITEVNDNSGTWDFTIFPLSSTLHTERSFGTNNSAVHELTRIPRYPSGSSNPKICEVNWNIEGWKCNHCSSTIPATLAPKYFDKLSHDVMRYGESASCINTGLAYGLKCRSCKAGLVEPVVIPATGKHTSGHVISKILLRPATEGSSGQVLIISTCKYCSATFEYINTVSMGEMPDWMPTVSTGPGGSVSHFTISFDANGGTLAAGSGTRQTNDDYQIITLPANPTRSGFKFNGWYFSPTEDGTRINTVMKFWSNATVYAHWVEAKGNVHSITFDLNDGTGAIFDAMATNADGHLPELPNLIPVREGYIFNGWFTEPTDGLVVTISSLFLTDGIVYAHWIKEGGTEPETFTVTFDFQYDGKVAVDPRNYQSNDRVAPLADVPSRTGYTFDGWFKDAKCETEWDFEHDFVQGDTILYAKWTRVPYKVTLDPNKGTLPTDQPAILTTNDSDKLDAMPKEPTREGYEFKGWMTSTGVAVDTDFAFTGDTTIYAQWAKTGGGEDNQVYTISFDLNYTGAPANPESISTNADHKLTKSLPEVSREGYTFDGWFTKEGGKVSNDTTFFASITLKAQWTKKTDAVEKTHTIVLDANGGRCSTASLTTSTGGTLTSLPTPTRDGYTFNGWYTASTGGEQVTTSMKFDADSTVYAHWTKLPDEPSAAKYQIYTPDYTSGGSVYVSHGSAAEGTRITIELSPRSGYEMGWLSVTNLSTGRELSLTRRYDDEYTFIMPASSVEVEVSFLSRYTNSGYWYVPEQTATTSKSNKSDGYYFKDGQIRDKDGGFVSYDTLLTRDTLLSVLYNMDPSSSDNQVFWAVKNNIIPDPWASGLQGVDKNITREQIAMILYCYSRHMGYDLSPSAALTGYSDYGQMRAIAQPAMSWAMATGLITSDSSNKLAPRSTVTCGEANTILTKFLSTVAKSR